MAGNFTSPSSNSTHMKHGSVKKPRGGQQAGGPLPDKPEYPITDDFAASSIPTFADRRAQTNAKSGFNTVPAKPPGACFNRPTDVPREAGKVVGRSEKGRDANSEGHGGSQQGYDEKS
jgi:hypothetical protein